MGKPKSKKERKWTENLMAKDLRNTWTDQFIRANLSTESNKAKESTPSRIKQFMKEILRMTRCKEWVRLSGPGVKSTPVTGSTIKFMDKV